jgi:hypothetical protein
MDSSQAAKLRNNLPAVASFTSIKKCKKVIKVIINWLKLTIFETNLRQTV